ncbi:hypothetical protein Tco_0316155 [Tanacetum coccineum]
MNRGDGEGGGKGRGGGGGWEGSTYSLLTHIEDLKAQLEGNLKVAARSSVKTKVLAPGMYTIDVEPIPHRLKNNRNAHLIYINHLKESVETVREIELVEYVIGTCPKEFTERDNKAPSIPLTRKKQVTFTDTCSTSTNNTQKHRVHQKVQQSNVQVIPSTGRSLLHDNIIPKPDLALELGKSISLTEAEEEAVAREVHATHARIVSESEPEPTQRRQSGIAFRDSFIVSKKRSSDSSKKLKGMKALKESKKMSKRQPGTGGSNEGTGNILGPMPSLMTPGYISSGLVQISVSPTPYVPPSKKDYEILAVDPVGSPSSTTIDQDEQSTSTSPTNQEIQSQVTHQDSAHPFESPLAGKTDITFTRRRVPSNWLMKMKFNRLLNLIWMIMSTIYNKTTRKLPVVEVKGKGSATDVQAAKWIIASQDETTGPSVHPEDATSTKMVRETLSHADAESGGNSEKINSETDTEILNVGSNSKQSHVALAGPNPEHMQDVFLATNYPKVHESLKHTTKEHVHLENLPSSSRTLSSMKNLEDS